MITFKEDTHQYFNENGDYLISVTTLLKKHGLAPDYSAVSQEVLTAKAERGTFIHKEIEEFIKSDELGFSKEVYNFKEYNEQNGVKVLSSEFIIGNDIIAGTADLLILKDGELSIADIKTTSALHKDAVSWQLSIYAYLYCEKFHERQIKKGYAYHFDNDGDLEVVEIALKPIEEIEKLLEAERNGVIYKFELKNVDNELMLLAEAEATIARYELQKKEAEEKAKELRAVIMQAMEENGVKSFENERIKLTYIAPTIRTTIDSAKFKKELPEIAEKYAKTSETKATLRITLKEKKENE